MSVEVRVLNSKRITVGVRVLNTKRMTVEVSVLNTQRMATEVGLLLTAKRIPTKNHVWTSLQKKKHNNFTITK